MVATAENEIFENAEIMFRNFAGEEKQFNPAGQRNFCLMLDPKRADKLRKAGWNVKELRALEEGDEPRPYINVAVNYEKGRPPRVVVITSNGRHDYGSEEVKLLDYADIKQIDVIVNPYSWSVGDKDGIKAYLKSAFVTLNEDELEKKYASLPEANPTRTLSLIANEGAA